MNNKETLCDNQLVQQFVGGNQYAIENLIHRHKNRVYTYILLIVKNQHLAEDILQDTFIKVINSLKHGRYVENGKFISWVIRIAHNLIIDHFRKEKHLNTISNDGNEYDLFNSTKFAARNAEEDLVHSQITQDVKELVNKLPLEQREVVVMRHYMELSFKEIADQTGVSINTALGRMRYALINMRKMIEEKKLNLNLV